LYLPAELRTVGQSASVLRWRAGRCLLAGAGALIVVGAFAGPSPLGATPYSVQTEQLVLQLSEGAETHPSSLLVGLPGPVPELLPGRRWSTDLPSAEAAYVESELSGAAGVDYVSPVRAIRAAAETELVPNNPCYVSACGPTQVDGGPDAGHPIVVEDPGGGPGATIEHPGGQTDLQAVNAAAAWGVTTGSPNATVAVLDTGVDPEHPQLIGKVVVGQDVCKDDRPLCASADDENGHGTMVTGLIAAATNDGLGIAGLGWNTQVIDFKVLDDTGNGNTADEATGIYEAVSAGAKVINMSFASLPCTVDPTGCGPNIDEEEAVEYAISHGVVVVAAAGNAQPGQGPSSEPLYPAAYPGVLSVAASTDGGVVDPTNGGPAVDFSEYGNAANIAAPGIGVLSTWWDGNYAVESGTSFSAPLVAAAAALVLAADPSLSGPQVATLLRQTASPLSPGGTKIDGGLLNVGAAVQAAVSGTLPGALDGYQLVGREGGVYSSGVTAGEGSIDLPLSHPIVGAAETSDGLGYWLVSSAGEVFTFGDARSYRSSAKFYASEPVVGIAVTPNGKGYWLVAQNGRVVAYGNARSYRSSAKFYASEPVVGIVATPDGKGYWLVDKNGKVFAYGDAHFYGSATKYHLAKPIVGIAATPDGRGYWLAAADGRVLAFGDATFYPQAVSRHLASPIVGIAASPYGRGYWLAGAGGKIFAFGKAPFEISATSARPSAPIVSIVS
jgi:subtilisin family serine protease